MLTKDQLKKGSWYKGFHQKCHVAKWTGSTFVSIADNVAFYCDHITDWHDGFEPTEEIQPLPESLKNETQLQNEIDRINEIAMKCIK